MRFSADCRWLVYHATGCGVVVRDAATGNERLRLKDYAAKHVQRLELSADGATLAVSLRGELGQVFLHDLKAKPRTPRVLRADNLNRHLDSYTVAAFSPDGTKLGLVTDGHPGGTSPLGLWDVASGRRLAICPGRGEIARNLVFTPDGRSVFFHAGNVMTRWLLDRSASDRGESLAGHTDEAWSVAFSADGRWLATGSDDTDEKQTIRIWNRYTVQQVGGWFAGEGTVAKLAFSPDGKVLASAHLAEKDNVRIWDPATGKLVAALPCRKHRARAVAFSGDGAMLAVAEDDDADQLYGAVRVWDLQHRRILWDLTDHKAGVPSLAFSPDGSLLGSAGDDGVIRICRAKTGEPIARMTGRGFMAVSFTSDGTGLAAADRAGVVTVWDAATGTQRMVLPSGDDKLLALALSPKSPILAAAGISGKIHIWDLVTGQELLTLEGHKSQINGLAFSPDGSTLASCSHDGAVKLWHGGP
jgi:WD40 repeat protein